MTTDRDEVNRDNPHELLLCARGPTSSMAVLMRQNMQPSRDIEEVQEEAEAHEEEAVGGSDLMHIRVRYWRRIGGRTM
jgi:hypothetical protein